MYVATAGFMCIWASQGVWIDEGQHCEGSYFDYLAAIGAPLTTTEGGPDSMARPSDEDSIDTWKTYAKSRVTDIAALAAIPGMDKPTLISTYG